jgi:hypothetical protein
MESHIDYRKICTICLYGWIKLQISHSDIKINLDIFCGWLNLRIAH